MNKPFNLFLPEMRFGETVNELTEKMAELVAAVGNTNKGGSLTLTIKLKPAGCGAIEITDEIKARIPELPRGTSLFFATPKGNLQRNDPRQGELDGLRSVEQSGRTELKEVAG